MDYPIDDLSFKYRDQFSAINHEPYGHDYSEIGEENSRLKTKLNKINVQFQRYAADYEHNLDELEVKNAKLEQVCRKLAEKVAQARFEFKEYKMAEEYRSQEQSSHLIERVYELEKLLLERSEENKELRRLLKNSEEARCRDESKMKRFQELLRSEFNN